MTNSPKHTKNRDSESPVQSNGSIPQADPATTKPEENVNIESTTKAEPLAPPPRPEPPVGNTPDYFSVGAHLSTEANPFEYSFSGQTGVSAAGDQTPGGTKLPSLAALTSPAGILGGGQTPNFWGSLRSGPLSPAMLSGPQKDDYFSDGHHLRGAFPTPNESGLRSGLTPGGGGSMFPEPSPNTAALFSSLASGGATPTTLDFHRTAMNAAAAVNRQYQQSATSQPQEMNSMGTRAPGVNPNEGNDANDAANGLFLLAQAQDRNGPQQTNHYAPAPQMAVHSHAQPAMNMGGNSHEASPNINNRNNGSISTTSGRGGSEMSDEHEQPSRPNTRGKGKRTSTQISQTNGRRVEAPAKGSKKSKANNGHAVSMAMEPEPQMSEEEQDMTKDEYNANGKKMTDEEKRKNFLERNRVAALKCRQRKKQWLANLQQKVEIFSTENDALSSQIGALREELVNLKTLLLQHKDCPVTAQQGIGPMVHQLQMEGYNQQMSHNPYGMAGMPQGVMNGHMPPQQRRYS